MKGSSFYFRVEAGSDPPRENHAPDNLLEAARAAGLRRLRGLRHQRLPLGRVHEQLRVHFVLFGEPQVLGKIVGVFGIASSIIGIHHYYIVMCALRGFKKSSAFCQVCGKN